MVILTIALVILAGALLAMPEMGKTKVGEDLIGNANAYLKVSGNLHPLILHLPIGIVTVILLMDVFGFLSFGRWKPQTTALLFFAVCTAALTNIAGFIWYKLDYTPSEELDDHMWAGLIFSAILTFAFIAKLWSNHQRSRNPLAFILLVLSAVAMGYGAHIGGVRLHGDPFDPLYGKGDADDSKLTTSTKPVEERLAYEEVVVPILQAKCYDCHSEGKKKKGGLHMNTIALLEEGGEEGPALVPGNLEESWMIKTIHLPMDDDYHMPPEKKPQLEAHEIQILEWWVKNMAPTGKTLTEAKAPAEILEAAGKMVSPEERKAMEEKKKAEEEKKQAEALAAREKLDEAIADLKNDPDFKNGLTPTFTGSDKLSLSVFSLREKFTDEHLAKLKVVSEHMQDMDLSSSSVTDQGVNQNLPAMKNLKVLKLAQTKISDSSIDTLAGLTELETINLYGTQVTNEGVKKLAALPNLKSLYLWDSKVTPEIKNILKEMNPNLKVDTGPDTP